MGRIRPIPGQLREHLLRKKRSPEIEEVQFFFRPIKDKSGKAVDWILVGQNSCTKARCKDMVNSCSSCRVNVTSNADALLAKAQDNLRPSKNELVVARPGLVLPKGTSDE